MGKGRDGAMKQLLRAMALSKLWYLQMSEEEMISAFPTVFVLWKYIQSSLWLKSQHPVLCSLRAFVSAVIRSAKWTLRPGTIK